MGKRKQLTVIVLLIIILSAAACIAGLLPGAGHTYTVMSQWDEEVEIHGSGLYQRDSESYAVQAAAQDWVTLIIGLPLLIVSLVLYRKNSYRGKLLLTGVLGYFLYTYMSYSFLVTYNSIFLIYIAVFSLSLFGFILSFLELNINDIQTRIKKGFPAKSVSIFFIFIAVMLLFMWLGRIIPSISTGTAPEGLETYTTLVIQAMDLGIIVPTALISAFTLLRRKNIGYALTTIVVLKGATLFTAVSVMGILMKFSGIEINPAELIIFPAATLVNFLFIFLILRNIE